jgi:hypothetical protein
MGLSWAKLPPRYLLDMLTFVRVAHRHGWQVEVVRSADLVKSETLASREEALAYAESLDPDWIEVGDIIGLGTPAQQHAWTTLRRRADGMT